MIINEIDNSFVVENSFTALKATIHGRRKWGSFLPSLILFFAQAFCIMPIVSLGLLGLAQEYFSGTIQSIFLFLAFGLFLYILYKKFMELAEDAFDQETVEIGEHSITVERSGFLFLKTKKTFLAENVKGITSSFYVREQFNFLNRIPFASSGLGAFMIWHGHGLRPFYNFGSNVSQQEAESFLESVYRKFPKYRYTGKA